MTELVHLDQSGLFGPGRIACAGLELVTGPSWRPLATFRSARYLRDVTCRLCRRAIARQRAKLVAVRPAG